MQTIEHKDFTVILTSKNQANVIFNYSYEKLKEKISDLEDKKLSFKDTEDLLSNTENIVNLTDKETINYKNNPPVLIETSSQTMLELLLFFFPQKKFVLVYSWQLPEKYYSDEYDDYLDSLWEATQDGEISEYSNEDGIVEVVEQLLKVYVTDDKENEDPWLSFRKEIFNFPTNSESMQLAIECGCGNRFEYDDLRIFEKDVFENLEIIKVEGDVDYEGESFPLAPALNLEVEKYKNKLLLK